MATIIIYRIIQYLDFAVGTLSAMLDEFALNLRKVSDDSLSRDETPRHAAL